MQGNHTQGKGERSLMNFVLHSLKFHFRGDFPPFSYRPISQLIHIYISTTQCLGNCWDITLSVCMHVCVEGGDYSNQLGFNFFCGSPEFCYK